MIRAIVHSVIVALTIQACGPYMAPPASPRELPCAQVPQERQRTAGVVGCVVDRLPDGSALSAAELERRMVHVLLDRLLATGRIAVVDRTVLREVLAEHALNLSGLVSDAASDNEPAIRATDYLVLVKASGFTISKRRFRDIPEIGDSPFLVRGTACCIVHMEIVSSRTGEVVWTDSEKGTASSLVEQESEIDTPGLLVTCATEALSRTVERLRCISLP